MRKKPIFLGTLTYTLVTFPLAVVWHVILFKPFYESVGYFGGEPNFALGFLTILIQGVVLSAGYGLVRFSGRPTARGLKYALLMGLFFWTSHVLAFAAKHPMGNSASFYLLETLYLCLQFGIYGLLISRVYGALETRSAESADG